MASSPFNCRHSFTVCIRLLVMGTLMRHLSFQIPLLPRCVQASPTLGRLILLARAPQTLPPPFFCAPLRTINVAPVTTPANSNLYPTPVAVINAAIFTFHSSGHLRPPAEGFTNIAGSIMLFLGKSSVTNERPRRSRQLKDRTSAPLQRPTLVSHTALSYARHP
jgi:hypothetical protein